MVVVARVHLQVVGPVVEGRHLLAADRAIEVAVPPRVLDRRDALLFGRLDGRLQLVELVMVKPAPVAAGAMVDLDAVMMLDDELGTVAGTFHALAS